MQAWQALGAGVADQIQLSGQAGVQAFALQLKVGAEIQRHAHIGDAYPRRIDGPSGIHWRGVWQGRAGPHDHHIVPQIGGAFIGQKEHGLVSLEQSPDLHLAALHAGRDLS